MAPVTSYDEKLRSQLIKVYQKLSLVERIMVQLLSVVYEPINRTNFLACWNALSDIDCQGIHLGNHNIARPYFERLIELQVVSTPNIQCNLLLVEIASRDAVQEGRFQRLVDTIEKQYPLNRDRNGVAQFASRQQFLREVRIGFYRNDLNFVKKQFEDFFNSRYNYYGKDKTTLDETLLEICSNPLDINWLRSIPSEMIGIPLTRLLRNSLHYLTPAPDLHALLEEKVKTSPSCFLRIVLLEHYLYRGQWQKAQKLYDPHDNQALMLSMGACLSFLGGENEGAIGQYEIALKALRREKGKRKVFFDGIPGICYVLALIASGSADHLKKAQEYLNQYTNLPSPIYVSYHHLIGFIGGDLSKKDLIFDIKLPAPREGNSFEALFCSLCLYWVDAEQARKSLPKLVESIYRDAQAAGYIWLAKIAGELFGKLKNRSSYADHLLPNCPYRSIVNLIQPQEPWELSLNALTKLYQNNETTVAPKPESQQRLVWLVKLWKRDCTIQAREQSASIKGVWSKGRPVALKRLRNQINDFSYLTSQDIKICSYIEEYSYEWGSGKEYSLGSKALVPMIGHPLVFWEDAPTVPLEIVKGTPELLVKKEKDKTDRLILQFSPEITTDEPIHIIKEGINRLKVIEITDEHQRIAMILGPKNRLEVPESAKDRVLDAIHAISGVLTVHSDIGGGLATAEVPADPRPHIHLLPAPVGLKAALLVRPFASGGGYYQPGTGGVTVIAEIDGQRLQTTRNFSEEKKLAKIVTDACPTLSQADSNNEEWLIEDPEACLELLLELQTLKDQVVIEHPEGEKFRIAHQADFKNFRLQIKRHNDWFETEGGLQIDHQNILDMQQLMQLLDRTPSRFIPIGDGQFVALTKQFRKRLDELRTYSERSKKGMRLHALAAFAIEDWIDEVGELQADQHWKAHISKLKEVQSLEPQLPSTLQAELRDYQLDGFRWLIRLSHWGVGACLADDMGLGKTLQAIAAVLTRAPEGPTLVIAPTSVCLNWCSECQKFAPTLNIRQFGSGDRQKLIDQLQPFDILICSYGLLQQDEVAEMLAKVQWQTIVLDEAQSIKNFATKRSQAAMNLQGQFKLITTGTPIENHLGELWNLFRFINSGLLGSLESFNHRYAAPIERNNDRQARNRLKKLIQPFILRRTKNQVLQELPSRTEILLQVELSREEMAFYEALRREAIEKLADSNAQAGAKHLQVLAEIMKLRRSCCNTRLVKPEILLPSSKLQLFGEIVSELLENNHKALVFSQFVDHLHLIEDYLKEQKISYQYLDGSTPAPDRKKRVDAFQAGKGDVFLISLKAGGTGLNLTAADYVIHMDPWWNPAVEDQASDRAHRIGQQRPVTIYRLVAKGTIEEKIVQLHQQKRDLADSLLEGTEMSGKVSTEDLLRLISEV